MAQAVRTCRLNCRRRNQESVAQSFFKRMPIQSLVATTRRDRPARLADGLELERALVRDHWTPALFPTTRREQLAGVHAGSKPSPQRCLANEPPRLGSPLPCVARDSATSSGIVEERKVAARAKPTACHWPTSRPGHDLRCCQPKNRHERDSWRPRRNSLRGHVPTRGAPSITSAFGTPSAFIPVSTRGPRGYFWLRTETTTGTTGGHGEERSARRSTDTLERAGVWAAV